MPELVKRGTAGGLGEQTTRSLVVPRRLMIVAARLIMAAERLRRAPAMGTRLSHCCIGDSLV
jgi:hypothetical protein